MSNKKPGVIDADVIDRNGQYIQDSFDLGRLDNFVEGLGVEYLHYKGMPSPIGKNDRGDYHRSDGVDTITSNGMIYRCTGKFRAVMTDNQKEKKRGNAGIVNPSESLLVMPRFYGDSEKRIYIAPGDRIYYADPETDAKVSNAQEIQYEDGFDNSALFPIIELEMPIIDSRNIEYIEGVDFCITEAGNIKWLSGGKNPGIDPNTGKGRIYTIRYLYKAYWYLTTILKEVRITNVTDMNGERKPERMPYHVVAQREYIFHSINKGSQTNQNPVKEPQRQVSKPVEPINPSKYVVPVDMSAIGDSED